MSELQATIDDLEGADSISLATLISRMPSAIGSSLNNASSGTSNEISLAVNELQQAVNQLENGGITQSATLIFNPHCAISSLIENSPAGQRRHV